MHPFRDLLMLHGYLLALPTAAAAEPVPPTPREVVLGFLTVVRSGAAPERAAEFLAPRVVAHQLVSERPEDVIRTPEDYASHVREFLSTWGPFELDVRELLADGDRVYARWLQRGRHLAAVDGHAPTGRPVTELASAVYRVRDGRIVEYWIQVDRAGTEAQLRRDAAPPVPRGAALDSPAARPGAGTLPRARTSTPVEPRECFGPC